MESREIRGGVQIHSLKAELSVLKKQLFDLSQKKEVAFQKKENCKRQLYVTIAELRKIKTELSSSAKEKEELGKQRDIFNQKRRELIKQAKKNYGERTKFFKKKSQHINLHLVKEKIERLDTKIETEALQFDDEKKLMKNIKELKKKLKDAESIKTMIRESRVLSKEIYDAGEQADSFHLHLAQKRQQDKEKYMQLKNLSKKIKQLKKEQEVAFNEFIETKKEFLKKSEELQAKLKELGPALKNQQSTYEQRKQRRQQQEAKKIEALEQAVEEKLRTKKKITTEDLLVFQRK